MSVKARSAEHNRFGPGEWSGAFGDLGLLLPLAFALVVFNGLAIQGLFLLWGVAYIAAGWYFRIPMSVQPLKAMAVLALTHGYTASQLSTAAFLYGLLFLLLAGSGALRILERWFSAALVRGVQLGIGLLLLHKAVILAWNEGLFLGEAAQSSVLNIALMVFSTGVLLALRRVGRISWSLIFLAAAVCWGLVAGNAPKELTKGPLITLTLPEWSFALDALVLLIIPQLPLTLGNAVFAASETGRRLFPERALRATPGALGWSIGLNNLFIGMLGGFPVCHGAGGIAAHAQFGAQTGGASIIIGAVLVLAALISPVSLLLFALPVALLSAMLLLDAGRMMSLATGLASRSELSIAATVGICSFVSRNLAIALLCGFILERCLLVYRKHTQGRNA